MLNQMKYFRRKRRYTRRKRFTRGKFGRRSITSRIRSKPRNRVQSVVHRVDTISPVLVSSNTVDATENLAFDLNQFPGTGPFVQLYHQYRINKVKVEYFPVNTQARYQLDGEQPADTFTPSLYTAVNRTSSAFAASVTDFMSMNSCKYITAGRYHKRFFTPCTLDAVYGSVTASAYNPEFKQWISTAYPRAPHFGLGALLSASQSSPGSFKYRRVMTIYVQYKNRRPNTTTSLDYPVPLAIEDAPRVRVSTSPSRQREQSPRPRSPSDLLENVPSIPLNKGLEPQGEIGVPRSDPAPDLDSLYDEIKLKRAQLLNKLV